MKVIAVNGKLLLANGKAVKPPAVAAGSELVLSATRLPAVTICTDVIENHFVSSIWSPSVTAVEYISKKYYYNGELLPEIPPVYESIPYRVILKWPNGNIQLIGSVNGLYFNGDTLIKDISGSTLTAYYLAGYNWTEDKNQNGKYSGWTVISNGESVLLWSSHDIPNGSATATEIYFEGSEPILAE